LYVPSYDLEDEPYTWRTVYGNQMQCPALLVPQNYGLVKDQTHAKTHRALILIAKVLQNLASKNTFLGKEVFMESMNGFINRNIKKVPVPSLLFSS